MVDIRPGDFLIHSSAITLALSVPETVALATECGFRYTVMSQSLRALLSPVATVALPTGRLPAGSSMLVRCLGRGAVGCVSS